MREKYKHSEAVKLTLLHHDGHTDLMHADQAPSSRMYRRFAEGGHVARTLDWTVVVHCGQDLVGGESSCPMSLEGAHLQIVQKSSFCPQKLYAGGFVIVARRKLGC